MQDNCPICSKKAEVVRPPGGVDAYDIVCPRCGNFRISRTLASTNLEKYGERNIISGIIRNRYENGEKLELHTRLLSEITQTINIPDNPFELIDILLKYVLKKANKIMNPVEINIANDYPILFLENATELNYYILKSQELGYIEYDSSKTIRLSLDGWKRLEEIEKRSIKSNQAFVAMWFDPELNPVWENGFKLALVESGYEPIRIDLQEHNEKICDRIISEIRKSGLLVADFTGQRGGVYFEAGFALGLGMPVIWTCRDSDVSNLHFDTRQYNHIVWKNAEDLKLKLLNRIIATIPNK